MSADRHHVDPVAGHHHQGQRQRATSRQSRTSGWSTPRSQSWRSRTSPRPSNRSPSTTLRKVVDQHTFDDTLSETDRINIDIKAILDNATEDWGVQATLVELKDIQLPGSMKRAMARQAEAEREKRAKIIAAG